MDLLGFGRSLSAGVLHLARFIEHRVCIRVKIAGESDEIGQHGCDEEERRGKRWSSLGMDLVTTKVHLHLWIIPSEGAHDFESE